MPLLSTADQDTLRARFAQALERDVRLVLFVEPPTGLYVPGRQESQTGRTAQQLMEEVAALSAKLRLEVHHLRSERDLAQSYAGERSPALILLPAQNGGSASAAGAGDAGQSEAHAGDQTGSPASQDASKTEPQPAAP